MKPAIPSLIVALLLLGTPATAQRISPGELNLQTIGSMLAVPEKDIDLAKAKLTIDRMIDPNIDVANGLRELDALTASVKSRVSPNATSRERVEVLRTFLYQPGEWNGNRPFQYDMADPLGQIIRNKLLPNYLSTRKGNCISMPLLFIILGQRLGIDVTAARAPGHVFVKYRDEKGSFFNLETTSGAGFTSDAWIQKNMPMTPEALSNGIYMRPLTKKETLAVIVATLIEFYGEQGRHEDRIELALLTVKHHPTDVTSMLQVSMGYQGIRRREFESRYAKYKNVPPDQLERLRELDWNIRVWGSKAEALGWRPTVREPIDQGPRPK